MKRNRLATLIVLIAESMIGAPAGFAQNGLSIRTAQPTRLTVAPNVSSPIAMKTLPNATCVLHTEGASDDGHRLKLFADDDGMILFHVNPEGESEEAVHFEVDCAADGKISIFPLHLRFSSAATADVPPPSAEIRKLRPGSFVRPALSNDEALNLSTEELVRRNYPIRPDPTKEPAAFDAWLKAVTIPSGLVFPRAIANPEITHGPATSFNWSGFALTSPGPFSAVTGTWAVPNAWGPPFLGCNPTQTYSALWIGLDGMVTKDLVQAGTEQDSVCVFSGTLPPFFPIHFDTYYVWTEYLPLQPTEQRSMTITAVWPGDHIAVQIMMVDVCCGGPGIPPLITPAANGNHVNFNIHDYTQNEEAIIDLCTADGLPSNGRFYACPTPTPAQVPGYTAEWIMERPYVNGVLTQLANYGVAELYGARAMSGPTWAWVNYGDATNQQISMYGPLHCILTQFGGLKCNQNLLSQAYAVNNSDIQYVWSNYQ